MAWTTPRTWVTGETVTAAIMNVHVRDNLNATGVAKVTTAGDTVYATGANAVARLAAGAANSYMVSTGSAPAWRTMDTDSDANSDTISFASLGSSWYGMHQMDSGTMTNVSVTVTTGTAALVLWQCRLENSTGGAFGWVSYAISGATTLASNVNRAIIYESGNANDAARFSGFAVSSLNAGSNTFTLQGRTTSGVETFSLPYMTVIPL